MGLRPRRDQRPKVPRPFREWQTRGCLPSPTVGVAGEGVAGTQSPPPMTSGKFPGIGAAGFILGNKQGTVGGGAERRSPPRGLAWGGAPQTPPNASRDSPTAGGAAAAAAGARPGPGGEGVGNGEQQPRPTVPRERSTETHEPPETPHCRPSTPPAIVPTVLEGRCPPPLIFG